MNASPPVHRTTSTMAVVSLVFGIASWCMLPVVGAIVAIVCGHVARGEIRRSQGQLEGDGPAVGGLVLGYLQLAVGVFALFVALFFLGLGVTLFHFN